MLNLKAFHHDTKNSLRILALAIVLLFLGSIFITSHMFVDPYNTPKSLFVAITLFSCLTVFTITLKKVTIGNIHKVSKYIFGTTVLQALYGLAQAIGIFNSNHRVFPATGSFDNPAGFASLISLTLPLGTYLYFQSYKRAKQLLLAGLLINGTAVIVSGSRTGMLAGGVSLLYLLYYQTSITDYIKRFFSSKFLIITLIVVIGITGTLLFYLKKDSANGRLLIWNISICMIKDQPLTGHGNGGFRKSYMDYQAQYFRNHPESKHRLLAGNTMHPFNEFIKIAVEYGLISLLVVITLILWILFKLKHSRQDTRYVAISAFLAFLIIASFSYPSQYIAVWLLLTWYFLMLIPEAKWKFSNSKMNTLLRTAGLIIGLAGFYYSISYAKAEIRWKDMAMMALKNNTKGLFSKYKSLYPQLKNDPFFLYNYGAELNIAGQYKESIHILKECNKALSDYYLTLLTGDAYSNLGMHRDAIASFQKAACMIPSRFIPLNNLLDIYTEIGDAKSALKIAVKISKKKIKVPSQTVYQIIAKANHFIDEHSNRCHEQ
jgi:O-antigen polymerase